MSRMQLAYERLRDLIVTLQLAPGERLSESWLESFFQGSRTPIRAALGRLEAEGLVQRGKPGYMVAPIDLREIEQVYAFRETVESEAVRLVCNRATPAELDAIAEILDSCQADTPSDEWYCVATDFHVEIARLSDNPFFARSLDDAMTRVSRARWLKIWSQTSRDHAWAEHRRILELIRARKAEEAATETARHVRESRDWLLKSLSDYRRSLRTLGFAVVA